MYICSLGQRFCAPDSVLISMLCGVSEKHAKFLEFRVTVTIFFRKKKMKNQIRKKEMLHAYISQHAHTKRPHIFKI